MTRCWPRGLCSRTSSRISSESQLLFLSIPVNSGGVPNRFHFSHPRRSIPGPCPAASLCCGGFSRDPVLGSPLLPGHGDGKAVCLCPSRCGVPRTCPSGLLLALCPARGLSCNSTLTPDLGRGHEREGMGLNRKRARDLWEAEGKML